MMQRKTLFLFFLGLIGFFYLFSLFLDFDWNSGRERTVLLWGLLLLLFMFHHFRELVRYSFSCVKLTPILKIVALVVCLLLFGRVAYWAGKSSLKTDTLQRIPLDIGQSTYRAWSVLKEGKSPYEKRSFLDINTYFSQLKESGVRHPCYEWLAQPSKKRVFDYWDEMDLSEVDKIFPRIKERKECEGEKRSFLSMAYKYGPVLPFLYGAFFEFFGKAGIFICHFFIFIFFLSLFFLLYRSFLKSSPWAFFLFLLLFLVPWIGLENSFINSSNELIPSLFLVLSLVFFDRRKKSLFSPFFFSLSLSCKFLPGALLVPLLLFYDKKQKVIFFSFTFLFFLPFFIWSPGGVFYNLIYFNLVRPSDSTALSYYLPYFLKLGIQVAGIVFLLVFWKKSHLEKFSMSKILLFSLFFMGFVLSTSKVFHNNYLVWFQVLTAYKVFVDLSQKGRRFL